MTFDEHAVQRVEAYLDQWSTMGGLHPEIIHSIGTEDGLLNLTVPDLRTLVRLANKHDLKARRDFHRTEAEEARQRATRLPYGEEQTEAWRLNSHHLALRAHYDAVIDDQTSIAAS